MQMTKEQRQLRMNIRNAYLIANLVELEAAIKERKSQFEIDCLNELIKELDT